MWSAGGILATTLVVLTAVGAVPLDINDDDSIKKAAATVAKGMMNYYKGNLPGQTPGEIEGYYWWEVGGMMGALIDYWYYTGDTQYNDAVIQAIPWQATPNSDFMPANQTSSEANDDQAFWAFTALSAAELGFPNPPASQPQYIAAAQGAFNTMVARWDNTTCNGGLHWQFNEFHSGYNYKSSIANGGLFTIGARLWAYTQNETYYDWANKVYDWLDSVGAIGPDGQIFDGVDSASDCKGKVYTQWTYNAGVFLHGAAAMYAHTTGAEQDKWRARIELILNQALSKFFEDPQNKTMAEMACEHNKPGQGYCDADQLSFKTYLGRSFGFIALLAPWTYNLTAPYLQVTAQSAAQSCSGGSDGVTCGTKWWVDGWDGEWGLGQQMCALEVILPNLVSNVKAPFTEFDGGTSKGNATAGTGGSKTVFKYTSVISTGDRVGAGAITGLILIGVVSGAWWLMI
ncbi:glycoside hydrolase [Acrodontium crateriforme]|uniref:Mannan endo-1,6-alpha-mannosidase n=1 Tax=Acrodontium crateriforme TaxID=150365 RepID=A0AAQ3LZR5_9PEZI|nr:glycoside hydrolase [Acrodontium crateriforme]